MAHELTKNQSGQYEMMYVGQKPWHGLGQKLDKPATAEEAITAANLNWTVSQREIITADGIDLPNHRAIVRDDNKDVFGVMTQWYQPIQNAEAFGFFDSVVGTGQAIYETAGSIFGGRRIFLTAKLPGEIRATKDDVTQKYLTLINGHDGSLALRMYYTPVRVVCNNTLNASLRDANSSDSIAIYHRGNVEKRIKDAQDALGLAHRYYDEFQNIVDRLVAKQVGAKMVDDMLAEIFQTEGKDPKHSTAFENAEKTKNMFENDPKQQLAGIKGTMWAFYNAVAQYADHEATVVKGAADKRFNAIVSGTSAGTKQKAMKLCLKSL